ncbi:MAG: hypothetical protein HY474_01095 [Candidatus Sungbacteria bacterium]|uniref:Uncharacterized protein n=1 Tax=Candidatus Sungiibacteriota bacterium TaxID=2750080 RepID=A0A933DRC8_9BACT|nr:hypothetical protein [Candidatus Sungbacteria bacterium]
MQGTTTLSFVKRGVRVQPASVPGRRRTVFRAASLFLNAAGLILAAILLAKEHNLRSSLASADMAMLAFFSIAVTAFTVHLGAMLIAPGSGGRLGTELSYCGWNIICGAGLGLAAGLFIRDPHAFIVMFSVGGQATAVYYFTAFFAVSVVVLAGAMFLYIRRAFIHALIRFRNCRSAPAG